MPLVRYFLFVGGVLLALLFASDAFLPKLPVVAATTDPGVGKSVIRIHSDRKWPERVVFDTSLPTIVPAAAAKIEASIPAAAAVADGSAKARVREALAQLPLPDAKQVVSSDPKKPELKPQRKPKIAKRRVAPPVMLVAQQPRFGFFDNSTWNSTW
jgi:hypothetical protein